MANAIHLIRATVVYVCVCSITSALPVSGTYKIVIWMPARTTKSLYIISWMGPPASACAEPRSFRTDERQQQMRAKQQSSKWAHKRVNETRNWYVWRVQMNGRTANLFWSNNKQYIYGERNGAKKVTLNENTHTQNLIPSFSKWIIKHWNWYMAAHFAWMARIFSVSFSHGHFLFGSVIFSLARSLVPLARNEVIG